MPDPDANSQGLDFSKTETQWHDRILADAIGYTRSLAAVLESLTEGFRRRGRDLEEHKQRLTILQNERHSVLKERSGLEATLRGLASERDTLQATQVAKDQELGRLRQVLEEGQAALETRGRQADELQASLREALTTSEERLAAAQRDLASAQQLTASLRSAMDEGKGRTTILEIEVEAQEQECVRLGAAVQSLRGTLSEIGSLVGVPPDTGSADLVTAVRRLAEQATQTQVELASQKSLLQPLQEVLGTTENLSGRVGEILAERRAFEGQLQEIVAERQRLQEELAVSAPREQRAREEAQRLSEQGGAVTAKLDTPPAAVVPEPRTETTTPRDTPPDQRAEAAPEGPAIISPSAAPPAAPAPETAQATPAGAPQPTTSGAGEPQGLSAVLSVECKVEGPGEDTLELLQGQPSRINEVGMVIAFNKCLPAGRVVRTRLTRGGGDFSVAASVVRTQPSKGTAGGPASFDHLIRFEHPNLDSSRRLKEFLA